MNAAPQVLFVFVDGLGLGLDDPGVNPLRSGCCPSLDALLREESVPMDVCMGVPGVPQSATGQTALLTGVNAAQVMGRHIEGFPGARLREVIAQHNVFGALVQRGLRATFANAYFVDSVQTVRERRIQSVTTVAALSGLGTVRMKEDLFANRAVFHDLTREGLRERGYEGPLITPAESARHLLAIARENHLTLFEYFLTDRAGHSSDPARARRVLGQLDEFLAELLRGRPESLTLILTSDHGNIEDLTHHGHTRNPVPFAAVGAAAAPLKSAVRCITDVTPALLAHFDS